MIIDNLAMIVAVDKNLGIGKDNKLLCHLEDDLKYFKEMTTGCVVVMGYNTYDSLPIKPLPNRINIVMTRRDIEIDSVIVAHSINEVIGLINGEFKNYKAFICGGEMIYREFIDISSELYITHIFDSFEADTFFPELNDWEVAEIKGSKDSLIADIPHVFARYTKR